jgi:thioredoxin-like negative regulator of GroEL
MPPPIVHVACLCAAWCHLCTDYAPVFEQACAELAAGGVALQWHWIDIEDEAEWVGNFDVETFPTIVIADARALRFAGPVAPQPETLRRLLRATVRDAAPDEAWSEAGAEARAFAARLCATQDAAASRL